jgi:O-antigen ligase
MYDNSPPSTSAGRQNMARSNTSYKGGVWSKRIAAAVHFILLHDELAATLIIAVHLYVDWYLGLAFLAQLLTLGLLFVVFLHRSSLRPWVKPRALWLWILFLLMAIIPATYNNNARDGIYYYFNVIFNALLLFWLGLAVAQDAASVRRLFKMLAFFAALLAIHTIIEASTGVLLFKTMRYDASIQDLLHFELGSTGIFRAEAFLLNPDSNGALFAMMLLLPFGLFVESSSVRGKMLYLVEMLLMMLALLFTFSTGAWIAASVGLLFFIVFAARMRYRIQISLFILFATLVILVGFPSQLKNLLQHASAPDEWSLRIGVWQTGIRVIQAYPQTGIGLGRYNYIQFAEPFRVPAQFVPVYHPHNSYLELAALGGIPLALVFIALLSLAFWLAVRNWLRADASTRSLLAGGLASVIALSFYSLSNAGWTLTPLTAIGWLIMGVIASPLLVRRSRRSRRAVDGWPSRIGFLEKKR